MKLKDVTYLLGIVVSLQNSVFFVMIIKMIIWHVEFDVLLFN